MHFDRVQGMLALMSLVVLASCSNSGTTKHVWTKGNAFEAACPPGVDAQSSGQAPDAAARCAEYKRSRLVHVFVRGPRNCQDGAISVYPDGTIHHYSYQEAIGRSGTFNDKFAHLSPEQMRSLLELARTLTLTRLRLFRSDWSEVPNIWESHDAVDIERVRAWLTGVSGITWNVEQDTDARCNELLPASRLEVSGEFLGQ